MANISQKAATSLDFNTQAYVISKNKRDTCYCKLLGCFFFGIIYATTLDKPGTLSRVTEVTPLESDCAKRGPTFNSFHNFQTCRTSSLALSDNTIQKIASYPPAI